MIRNYGTKIKFGTTLVLLFTLGISAYVLSLNRAGMEDHFAVSMMQLLMILGVWLGMASSLVFALVGVLLYGGYFFTITFVKQMRADIGLHEMVWFVVVPAGAVVGGFLGDAVTFVERMFSRFHRQLDSLIMSGQLGMVGDRNTLEQGLNEECARSRRSLSSFSLVLLDAFNMEKVQQSLGADAPTQVSQKISQCIARNTRDIDRKGRLEGTQHGLIIVDADLDHTHNILNRITKDLAHADMEYRGRFLKTEIQMVSAIARFPEDAENAPGLLKAAESKLVSVRNALEDKKT